MDKDGKNLIQEAQIFLMGLDRTVGLEKIGLIGLENPHIH